METRLFETLIDKKTRTKTKRAILESTMWIKSFNYIKSFKRNGLRISLSNVIFDVDNLVGMVDLTVGLDCDEQPEISVKFLKGYTKKEKININASLNADLLILNSPSRFYL